MTYFPDLSKYSYFGGDPHPSTVNIGWLGESYEFPIGETSQAFRDRLFEFCRVPFCRMRGFHVCEFCQKPSGYPLRVEKDGKAVFLGSAEIRVIGKGKIYAAPNLIYHYVVEHNYMPPVEFIEAVLESPLPGTEDFKVF